MRKTAIILMICIFLFAAGVCHGAKTGQEFIYYTLHGALSKFERVEIVINQDGNGKVIADKRDSDVAEKPFTRKIDYKFKLSGDEMEAIKSKVREIGFFGQLEKEDYATDVGESTLRISLDGKHRELKYEFRPEFSPLDQIFWRLIHQAEAMDALKSNKSISEFYLRPAGDVLQPYLFKEPLQRYIHDPKNLERLEWALNNYTLLATTDEWLGLWARELNQADEARRTKLLSILVNDEYNMEATDAQREVITPLLFEYMECDYKNWAKLSQEKRELYFDVMGYLGRQRYSRSVPMLVDMVKQGYELKTLHGETFPVNVLSQFEASSLSRMGITGVQAAVPLLKDTNPQVRRIAANTMAWSVPKGSETFYIYAGRPEMPEYILKILRDQLPILRELSKSDADSDVRHAAQHAVENIEKGWPETPAKK